MSKIDWKKVLGISATVLGTGFVIASVVAKMKKPKSVFEGEHDQKNPFEGKKVVFVKDESEDENADGIRGHLESTGDSDYKENYYSKYIKRGLDILLSFGGLVLLSPALLGISLAIKIDDPGPVLFTQKRIGKNKQYFKLHKFRSMKMSTPHDVPTHQLENPDQYITKVGRFLRAHSLDELPQIWDIFIGNMSVIGPRPGLWNQDLLTAERDKYGANDVKPGLTGWAQINGRDELEIPVKAKLDGEYVKRQSLLFDIKCFIGTILSVVKGEGVVEGGTGELKKKRNAEKLKILVICQYYYPEPFRLNDICEEMVKRGHEVTVVTGEPNYPEGEIYKGYEKHQKKDEIINGVIVHRCPIVPRKTGTLHRFLNYYSYPIKAKEYVHNLVASDGKPFDVVFVNQLSPVMMSEPAIAYKKKYGTPVLMYCLDLWPESLIAGGVKRSSAIYRVFHIISGKIYRNVNRILVTSRSFRGYLETEFGVYNTDYLPQYAEGLFERLPYKEPETVINLVFAGNIGSVQSVETILKAANKLKDESVHFHIVGSGTDLERLKNIYSELDNITFYGRRPLEEMPEFYAKADAMLVTLQADPILSLTLPGKIQSYMAVGKPIIGAIDGEAAEVIREAECGFCGSAENVDELVDNIKRFIACSDKKKMGENAYNFYEAYFAKNRFMNKLEDELRKL